MNNEPIAWKVIETDDDGNFTTFTEIEPVWADNAIPLYTQDQLEKARKLGMQQEQALWELAASTQEIMDTHPVKEHFEDEPQAEELHEIMQSNAELTDEEILYFYKPCFYHAEDFVSDIRAILRKAQEK